MSNRPRPQLISRADLARRKGVTRGAVTRAAETFLRAACVGKRIDAAHPDVRAWLRGSAPAPPKPGDLMLQEVAPTLSQLAKLVDLPLDELQRDFQKLPRAVFVPDGHVCVAEFAARAGVSLEEIITEAAPGGDLAWARVAEGRLDLASAAAIAFMAAHPFARDKRGEPVIPDVNGEGYLAPACVDDDRIDVDHPVSQVFLARLGRTAPEAA